MDNNKFFVGDLVTVDNQICEILQVIIDEYKVTYKLVVLAFTRNIQYEEWHNQISNIELILSEEKLSKFDYKKPKYKFGQRVKTSDIRCLIRFIQFENYKYMYHIMDEKSVNSLKNGWILEESYLSV